LGLVFELFGVLEFSVLVELLELSIDVAAGACGVVAGRGKRGLLFEEAMDFVGFAARDSFLAIGC
jgi:hypothetical protein